MKDEQAWPEGAFTIGGVSRAIRLCDAQTEAAYELGRIRDCEFGHDPKGSSVFDQIWEFRCDLTSELRDSLVVAIESKRPFLLLVKDTMADTRWEECAFPVTRLELPLPDSTLLVLGTGKGKRVR